MHPKSPATASPRGQRRWEGCNVKAEAFATA
jgi:hypothetical protein